MFRSRRELVSDSLKRDRWRIAEWLAVGLAAIWLARFAYLNGGIVQGSDMPYYLDIGLRGDADPFILYRYTHVHALRLLSLIAGSTLAGVKLYSALASGLAVVLTYSAARALARHWSPLNGAAAVLMLLSLPLVAKLLLAPHVDTTLMLTVLAFFVLYVAFTRRFSSSRWIVMAMGLVFLIALRTKEVALVLAVLLPGLGASGDGEFSWPRLRTNLWDFLAGVLAGLVLFLVLNQLLLGTPLFGLRPSDISAHLDLWSNTIRSLSRPASTVPELMAEGGGAVFVLYVAAAVWASRKLPWTERILWLLPVALLVFLLLGSTRTQHTIVRRGFLAGMAMMSVLGSQIFTVQSPVNRRSRAVALGSFAAALTMTAFGWMLNRQEPVAVLLVSFIVPLIAGLILALIVIVRDRRVLGFPLFVLIALLGVLSAGVNLRTARSELQQSIWVQRFSVPHAFREPISSRPIESFFVSDAVIPQMVIQLNRDELAVSMNTALDLQTVRTDYRISSVDETMIAEMEAGTYSHVLVNASEWDWLRTAPQDRPEWRSRYLAFDEPTGNYFVLVLKLEPD
jgi:hypothetical protein